MTLKTSLFNKGIYKNTLYRFKWGSFLYFIALFFMVPFALLVQEPANLWEYYHSSRHMGNILCANDYLVFPILLAMAVPTVVAALVYHGVHSSKQGIFVHGLPVSRKANYISNLLASFTLMALPVILNGIILLIMSFNSYSELILPISVLYWTLALLSILFIMFSVATFCAYITGNAAAGIVVNAFVHVFPFVIALAACGVGQEFLYGFDASDAFIGNKIIGATPVYHFMTLVGKSFNQFFTSVQAWVYIAFAAVLYVLTYFVYKFRKIEACGDVAAFKSFRTVIKYAVVSSAAVLVLSLLISLGLGWTVASVAAFAVCAIVYFSCEMVLSKSLKVFNTYKGYLVFAAVMAALISFFAFTGVFGYETRIPEMEKIESASLGRGYGRNNYQLKDKENIALVTEMHKSLITDIAETENLKEDTEYDYLYVSYNLKGEKTLSRRYKIPREVFEKYMNRMYEIKDYKFSHTGIANVNVENVTDFSLNCSASNFHYGELVTEGASEIFTAIKKDIEVLSFTEIENGTSLMIDISLSETLKNNKTSKVFKEVRVIEGETEEYASEYFNIAVNGNYKNTMAALKKYGYYDKIIKQATENMYICKVPANKEKNTMIIEYKEDKGNLHEFYVSIDDCTKISKEDMFSVVSDMFVNHRYIYSSEGEIYMLFYVPGEDIDKMQLSSVAAVYEKDELPEYLAEYLK